MSPFLSDRHVPPLAPASFRREWVQQEKGAAEATPGKRVLFFTGCLIDKVYPQVAAAAIKALRHHGFAPVLMENEACCGIPALSSGDDNAFFRLMAQNMKQIGKMEFDLLVTACATCAFTIKKVWPMMAEKNSAQADLAEKIADRTKDITQVIAPLIAPPAGKTSADSVPVAYHDPCHLKKSLGVFREPRLLIEAGPGFRLTEMAAPDACCGMGGGFGITHYDMSKKNRGIKKTEHAEHRLPGGGHHLPGLHDPACRPSGRRQPGRHSRAPRDRTLRGISLIAAGYRIIPATHYKS